MRQPGINEYVMKSVLPMRNGLIILAFAILPAVMSCSRQKNIRIINDVHYSIHDDMRIIEDMGCIDYDSITFSDGSYAVNKLKSSPQNRLIRYVDKDDKLLATISAASEAYPQSLVYKYDEKGRLKYLLRFDELDDQYNCRFYYEDTDSACLHFRWAIDSIDFLNPDLERHIISEIIYGEDGYAHKITEKPTGKVIEAPDGYHLSVRVDPCENFWTSDLFGGVFLLKVDIMPSNDTGNYFIKHFVDFIPTTEED